MTTARHISLSLSARGLEHLAPPRRDEGKGGKGFEEDPSSNSELLVRLFSKPARKNGQLTFPFPYLCIGFFSPRLIFDAR